jgi:hypothetical protein
MKELMMLYGITLRKRYHNRQKAYFRSHISESYPKAGFSVTYPERKHTAAKITNIIAGDINKAELLFITAYDTPSTTLLPNYKYYPFHSKKNEKGEQLNFIVQIITVVFFAFCSYLFMKQFLSGSGVAKGAYLGLTILSIIGAVLVGRGRANSFNFNRNSASLAIMERIAEQCSQNCNIAFVFLDQSISSFHGYKEFSYAYGDNSKTIVVLDCVAAGDMILLAHRKGCTKQAKQLIELAGKNTLTITDREYSEEKADKNILAFGRNMLYLVSGEVEGKEFIVANTRSKRDIQVDMKRLDKVAKTLIEFAFEFNQKGSKNDDR